MFVESNQKTFLSSVRSDIIRAQLARTIRRNTFSKPMTNDSRICRPDGALDFLAAVSTKISLLTELGTARVQFAVTGNTAGPSLYHLLEVLGKEKVLGRIERALGNMESTG